MNILQAFAVMAFCAPTSMASFESNINYASPSYRHTQLGVDVAHVDRRSWKRRNTAIDPSELHFTHGVASGDPWPDSVILWTRVAPSNRSEASNAPINGTTPLHSHEAEKFVEADHQPVWVSWKVFEEGQLDLQAPKASGKAYTTSDIDYTIKIEAKNLQPLTVYNYRFTVCDSNNTIPLGRAKTAPAADDDVSEIDLAVFSCSEYSSGYFNVYGNAARKDKHDWVVHVGDYIYEYGATGERTTVPEENCPTLYDYRARHGQDYAWITTWDDHGGNFFTRRRQDIARLTREIEVADNAYRDGFVDFGDLADIFLKGGPEISTDRRKANAVRAYFEWMPIRQTDLDDGLRVWRSFQMGKLLDLIILNTRHYDRSLSPLYYNDDYVESISDDPSRTLMGSRQEKWFYRSLSESKDRGAVWRLVGNQIVFSRVTGDDGGAGGMDSWNGYVANRNRTLEHLYDNKIGNNIFLSGDSHQSWVSDLAWLGTKDYDPETGEGAVGVEFAGTAVTAPLVPHPKTIEPEAGNYSRSMIEQNEEMFWQEGYYRGYFHLSVTPEKLSAQFFGSPSVATRNSWDIPLANFTVFPGQNRLHRPEGGSRAESGALKSGEIKPTNLTLDTERNVWEVVGFDQMHPPQAYSF